MTEIREEIEASTARFISELGDVSEAQRHACKRAAERVALADALRRRALSGAEIDIADLVKLEDMADAAVAALRLPATGPKVQALQVTFVDPRTNNLPDGELQRLQDLLRKIEEGAVRVDGARVSDRSVTFKAGAEHVLQVGAKRFARVRLESGA